MKVQEVMRVHVNKVEPDATLPDIVDLMDLYQVVCIPVVDADGKPVGVVTEADIDAALLTPYIQAAAAEHVMDRARSTTVEQIMSRPAVCVEDEADVREAAALMVSKGYRRLPVISEGRVVGTVGRIDVCQAILECGAR